MGYSSDDFVKELKRVIRNNNVTDKYGGIEIHPDERDKLKKEQIVSFFYPSCKTQKELFDEFVEEYVFNYELFNMHDIFSDFVYANMSYEANDFYELDEDKADEIIQNWVYFHVDEEFFNDEILVNILLDTGNANHDFSDDDAFFYRKGTLPEESSMRFLAGTQDKEELLNREIQAVWTSKSNDTNDVFIHSCIDELENLLTGLGTITFCVRMKLFELFALNELISKEGEILITKDACVGLFYPFDGTGSRLGIKLDKDVKIPVKYIYTACPDGYWDKYGHDVKNTYGSSRTMWKGNVILPTGKEKK